MVARRGTEDYGLRLRQTHAVVCTGWLPLMTLLTGNSNLSLALDVSPLNHKSVCVCFEHLSSEPKSVENSPAKSLFIENLAQPYTNEMRRVHEVQP